MISLKNRKDLIGKNIVVYDLEIKKPINECSKGWNSHDEMGISVGCAFDYRSNMFRVFMDDNLSELVDRLNEEGTLVVAFNHINFDNKLLRATKEAWGKGPTVTMLKPDEELNNYDMMVKSKKGAGADKYDKGYRLDDHLKALKLPMKTANGIMAPIWWQEGKIGAVIDYCLSDVTQERNFFEHIYENESVASAARPGGYPIEPPVIGDK